MSHDLCIGSNLPFTGGNKVNRLSVRDTVLVHEEVPGGLVIANAAGALSICVASDEYAGVKRAARAFAADVAAVTGQSPVVREDVECASGELVLVGTLGHSSLVADLRMAGRVDLALLEGGREAFLLALVDDPLPGVSRALVVVGAGKRGTMYGLYELSRRMGVSPWHWFADVPAKKADCVCVVGGPWYSGEPDVRFRGFFINDEYPCLGGLVHEKFGGFTHVFYEHVFDLLLRLKGNYLWPAMWNDCFHDDDPENTRLADEMGVIIGTSHHEPLMRAWKEWQRYGSGPWNLETNRETIVSFWKKAVERQKGFEGIMTVGMRGDGDEALSDESRDEVLYDILDTQRGIIADVCGCEPQTVPQLWAVYKEVQEYYENGATVPDDILVMLCDDNWGNIRLLPRKDDRGRSGGYGLYYHFDYVGGPRNYKWINTSPIPRVRQQLEMAAAGGIDRLWIVNVGDIKPLEYPLSFFLDYAWQAADWPADRLDEYALRWAREQFSLCGEPVCTAIAECLTGYAFLNGRRKPELLGPETYSLTSFNEAERVLDEYGRLVVKVNDIKDVLPPMYRDAFYQLVEYPVCASANLVNLHVATARNRRYAAQGRPRACAEAAIVRACFEKDIAMRAIYNNEIAGGKWHHMMDQHHISYTYWQQPDEDVLPALSELVETACPADAIFALSIEGDESWLCAQAGKVADSRVLPLFCGAKGEEYRVELWTVCGKAVEIECVATAPWIVVDAPILVLDTEQQIRVCVNPSHPDLVPGGARNSAQLICRARGGQGAASGASIPLRVDCVLPAKGEGDTSSLYVASGGVVAIEAGHFAEEVALGGLEWRVLPGMGRTAHGLQAFPAGRPLGPDGDPALVDPALRASCVGYRFLFPEEADATVELHFSPDNAFMGAQGLRVGISVDETPVTIVNVTECTAEPFSSLRVYGEKSWDVAVADNVRRVFLELGRLGAGPHRLRYWFVDPGPVLQRVIVWAGARRESYLGPVESPTQA